MRKLILEQQDYQAADHECRRMQGPFNQAYQPLGDLLIDFAHSATVGNYRRELNLDNATAKVTYETGGTTYTREIFVSKPNQVVIVKLSSSKPGELNCKVHLASQLKSKLEASGANEIHLTGKAPKESAPNYLFASGKPQLGWVPPSIPAPGAAAGTTARKRKSHT